MWQTNTVPVIILFVILVSNMLLSISVYYQEDTKKVANASVDSNYPESSSPSPSGPTLTDRNLEAEVVFSGLTYSTDMAFLKSNDILLIEKDTGIVRRIINNTKLPKPLLDVNVATFGHRGMLGIAVSNVTSLSKPPEPGQFLANNASNYDNKTPAPDANSTRYVFLYYTAIEGKDGDDITQGKQPLGNVVYRYELVDNNHTKIVYLYDTPDTPAGVSTSTITAIGKERGSPLLDNKIDEATAGLTAAIAKQLHSISEDNAATIVKYVGAMKSEVNPADHYRRDMIVILCRFSKYNSNTLFKDVTRTNILEFLDSLRKTETQDPMHKWIGTYNLLRIHITRFFKWLYSPDVEPDKRPKPSVIENIAQLKRKEKSIYKPSDLWTQQDDLLFLKYCPTKREKCYHAISRDTSCRPHEIVKLKIRDIVFKTTGKSQYAEALVNGKTGARPIPLIDSIPYLKDYLDHEHPQPGNPNAPLICGTGRGLGRHIGPMRIYIIYEEYKKQIFPKLLESPNVLPEDKQRIRELLKKPWNPYIRRHSALTEKSTILKEHVLRQHAGWSGSSQMHLKYLHYFGNESNESLLEAFGIIDKGIQLDQLRPKQCPNCNEPNKLDSKFCANCRMILSYDAYSESLERQKEEKMTQATVNQLSEIVFRMEREIDELKGHKSSQ